jgi:hypothetical protein
MQGFKKQKDIFKTLKRAPRRIYTPHFKRWELFNLTQHWQLLRPISKNYCDSENEQPQNITDR